MKFIRPNLIAAVISVAICVVSSSLFRGHYSDSDPIQTPWANVTLFLVLIVFGTSNYLVNKPQSAKETIIWVAYTIAGFLLFVLAKAGAAIAAASFLS